MEESLKEFLEDFSNVSFRKLFDLQMLGLHQEFVENISGKGTFRGIFEGVCGVSYEYQEHILNYLLRVLEAKRCEWQKTSFEKIDIEDFLPVFYSMEIVREPQIQANPLQFFFSVDR